MEKYVHKACRPQFADLYRALIPSSLHKIRSCVQLARVRFPLRFPELPSPRNPLAKWVGSIGPFCPVLQVVIADNWSIFCLVIVPQPTLSTEASVADMMEEYLYSGRFSINASRLPVGKRRRRTLAAGVFPTKWYAGRRHRHFNRHRTGCRINWTIWGYSSTPCQGSM